MDDVKVGGINLSALLRNFDKLRTTVKTQGEIIERQNVLISKLTAKTCADDILSGVQKKRSDLFMKTVFDNLGKNNN